MKKLSHLLVAILFAFTLSACQTNTLISEPFQEEATEDTETPEEAVEETETEEETEEPVEEPAEEPEEDADTEEEPATEDKMLDDIRVDTPVNEPAADNTATEPAVEEPAEEPKEEEPVEEVKEIELSPRSAHFKASCERKGGKFLDEHEECENIDQYSCKYIGGNYLSCASACRHNPDAEICTLQCVEVCELL